jgi:hypothetical protein
MYRILFKLANEVFNAKFTGRAGVLSPGHVKRDVVASYSIIVLYNSSLKSSFFI